MDWLSYPRSFFISIYVGVHTIFMSMVVVSLAWIVNSRRITAWAIRYLWARLILQLAGVQVELRGLENIPPGPEGFLILFNHTSHLDIPMLYGYFPKTLAFGAKIELFKIPFFGGAMKRVGTLPIDRGDRRKVMRVYDEAITRVSEGEVFALAPEGTRQFEPQLGRFKRGPFEFAMNAKVNIVPVLIAGALEVLPKDSVWINMGKWHRKVIIQILPATSTKNLQEQDLDNLVTSVKGQMEPVYSQLNRELGAIPS